MEPEFTNFTFETRPSAAGGRRPAAARGGWLQPVPVRFAGWAPPQPDWALG